MLWESRGHFVALYCRLEQNGGGKKMIAILFWPVLNIIFLLNHFIILMWEKENSIE
jgi:hypothetical protein